MSNESVCSAGAFPFSYFDANGNTLDGTLNSDGSCIFPDATCDPRTNAASCCGINSDVIGSASQLQFICLFLALCPAIYLRRIKKRAHDSAHEEETPAEEDLKEKEKHIPIYLRGEGRHKKLLVFLFKHGFALNAGALVALGILIAKSMQESLTVTSRNAMLAINLATNPFYAIFQFIEDVVTVRLTYALGRGNKKLANRLLHTGLAGAFVAGSVGSIILSVIGLIPAVLDFFANPFGQTSQTLYPGCEFFTHMTASHVLPTWMLESWGLVGSQAGLVMSSFLMSSFEINALGWISLGSSALSAGVWFGFVDSFPNTLTLAGLYDFICSTAPPILSCLYLVSPLGANIQENTGVKLNLPDFCRCAKEFLFRGKQDDDEDVDEAEKAKNLKATKQLLINGLKIMALDVVVQGTAIAANYSALWRDPAVGYQLTAIAGALPQYGVGFVGVTKLLVSIGGSLMLAKKQFDLYTKFIIANILAACLFIPVIAMAVVPHTRDIAFEYGPAACEFAHTSECVPYFNNVMGQNGEGGIYTLEYTMYAMVFGAGTIVLYIVFRAILMTCRDYDYMLYSTVASAVIFVPFLAVVLSAPVRFENEAVGFYVAMNIPFAVMILAFLPRIIYNLYKMKNGIPGNWDLDHGEKNDEPAKKLESAEAGKNEAS